MEQRKLTRMKNSFLNRKTSFRTSLGSRSRNKASRGVKDKGGANGQNINSKEDASEEENDQETTGIEKNNF